MKYNPESIEPKWQNKWQEANAFEVSNNIEELKERPKYYVLDMFPYPSGSGLHVGHPEGYTATDVLARMKRMMGYNVLHPMGWDAFGLPAERGAMRSGEHPREITKTNTDNFRGQLQRLGFSYDWSREINTTDPNYFKWTQWIFLKLYEKGLAYLAEVPVNWCPALGTVLANEEVKDGKYVDTGDVVVRKNMKQWMLKITEYGDKLLEDLDSLDWPESIKDMQRNWIGKSTGAQITFAVKNHEDSFEVFTTRPDTLFGASYCVLSPEHPLVQKITSPEKSQEVSAYVEKASFKSDLERTELAKEKSGVFTGAYAINPVNQKEVPIWIADYVLAHYGTGAIMAVPAHDERDHEFAKAFNLDILQVIDSEQCPVQEKAHTGNGKAINSEFLNGLEVNAAKEKMIAFLEQEKVGSSKIQYKLRDWLFSRQRYWGEPFPLIHCDDGSIVPVPENELPVTLPHIDEYKPTESGEPPLGRANNDWLEVTLPDGRKGKRELNTMPQWAGSCWYYLRYIDPNNLEAAWNKDLENYWMPVDLYVGGVEHAVLHLLYARFWHKVLFDCGLVSTKEPFQKLFNQGMILAYSYKDENQKYYAPEDVEKKGDDWWVKGKDIQVTTQIEKMGKSKLNVVNPDDVVENYGADALRLYELFMGPLEATKPWQMEGLDGIQRFLERTWRLVVDDNTGEINSKITDNPGSSNLPLWKTLHKTIKKVEEDTLNMRFNTAISQLMIFVNEATSGHSIPKEAMNLFLRALSPYAPHIAEELWQKLNLSDLSTFRLTTNKLPKNEEGFCSLSAWPTFDSALLVENTVKIVIQVNGKKRDMLEMNKGTAKEDIEKAALALEKVKAFTEGKELRRVIVVPDKLVNIVV